MRRNLGSKLREKVRDFFSEKDRNPTSSACKDFYGSAIPSQKEEEINTALGVKYNSHLKVIVRGKNRFYGIATFSRYPIIRKGEIIHPGSSSLSIYTDVLIQKDTFRIYNNHLQSFRLKSMERSFIEEMTSSDEKETLDDVMSLSASLKKGFVRRAQQAQLLKDHVNKSPYPVIVAGDFNDTPVSYAYRKIRKGLNDSFVNSGYGAGFTYRGNYSSKQNRLYPCMTMLLLNSYFEIIKIKYSDHYPIIAYFRKKN